VPAAYTDPASAEYRRMVDAVAASLGVTSLRYQTIDGMVRSIGLPRESLCTHCWLGGRGCGVSAAGV
jgi:amidophosphoribosyltransferase